MNCKISAPADIDQKGETLKRVLRPGSQYVYIVHYVKGVSY